MLSDVTVQARNGLVLLNGTVNSSFEKEHAEMITASTKGVVDITNNLQYEHVWSQKSDWEVLADVREQFFWSPFVDENQIDIAVDAGVVTLSGVVDSWQEYRRAEQNAFQAGAKDVRNKLTVSSFRPLPYTAED
jgi:osmotically-inducible protein OsmY